MQTRQVVSGGRCPSWETRRPTATLKAVVSQSRGIIVAASSTTSARTGKLPSGEPDVERRWKWYPTWNEVKTHYIHEIGFVANMILATGATLFYITGICGLPGIYENMSLGLARGLFWLAYLLGGVFFVISSALYMLETQPTWYTPAPHLLGWHIGVWNMIGSVGWTLAASWGYCTSSACEYQSELTLIWASAGFFIGSALQWYEVLEKYPIDTKS